MKSLQAIAFTFMCLTSISLYAQDDDGYASENIIESTADTAADTIAESATVNTIEDSAGVDEDSNVDTFAQDESSAEGTDQLASEIENLETGSLETDDYLEDASLENANSDNDVIYDAQDDGFLGDDESSGEYIGELASENESLEADDYIDDVSLDNVNLDSDDVQGDGFISDDSGLNDSQDAASESNVSDVTLSKEVEDLKAAALELNRDLLILEEELLFPANTQVSVFMSVDVGEFFRLDAVKLKIDGEVIASHLYTGRQNDALIRGGIQRLYVGNVKSGRHEVTAIFTGIGPDSREYKRGATTEINKGDDPIMLEVRVRDSGAMMQPEFDFNEWEL
ncbi:MAG: hypothetical protein ACI93R_003086 [Flavobacteriales bacterium]|jgi:hypothetical protein